MFRKKPLLDKKPTSYGTTDNRASKPNSTVLVKRPKIKVSNNEKKMDANDRSRQFFVKEVEQLRNELTMLLKIKGKFDSFSRQLL